MADIIQDSDQFLVNRSDTVQTVSAANLMATIEDTDLMIINRADTVYTVTGEDVKESLQPSAVIDKPEILAPADGAGIGGGVTYTPKTSEITSIASIDEAYTTYNSLNTFGWRSVAAGFDQYGEERFMGVAEDRGFYSNDGQSFSRYPMEAPGGSTIYWEEIAYGNDTFVALSNSDGWVGISDGSNNFNISQNLQQSQVFGLAFGDGKFVAVANDSTRPVAVSSNNGANWSYPTGGTSQSKWYDVIYADSKWVAVGEGKIMYSTDALSWTTIDAPEKFQLGCVAYGNGIWVTCEYTGSRVLVSTDAIDWTEHTAHNGTWRDMEYIDGNFVVAGNGSVMSSFNGINWTKAGVNVQNMQGIAYGPTLNGPNKAVVVGNSGSTRIAASLTGTGFVSTDLTFADDKAYSSKVPLAWDESFIPPAGAQYSTFTFDGATVTKSKSANGSNLGIARVLNSFPNTTAKYSFQFGFAEGAAAGDQIAFGIVQGDLPNTTGFVGQVNGSAGVWLTVDDPSSTLGGSWWIDGVEYPFTKDSSANDVIWTTDTIWRIEYCWKTDSSNAEVYLYYQNPGESEILISYSVLAYTGDLYPAFGSPVQSQYNAGTGVITGTGESPDPTDGTWEGQTLEETFFVGDTVSGVKTGSTTSTGTVSAVSGQTMSVTPSGSDPFVDGMVVVKDGTVTIAAPSADDLQFVGSIPNAASRIYEWGLARWMVSESSDFSSPMFATKAITPGTTQTLLPSERGDIVLEVDKQYWTSLSYSAVAPASTSPESDAVTFQTSAVTRDSLSNNLYYDTNTDKEISGDTIINTYGLDPEVNNISRLGFAELTQQPAYPVAGYQAAGSKYQPIEDLQPQLEKMERRNKILRNYVAEDFREEVEAALKEAGVDTQEVEPEAKPPASKKKSRKKS